MYIDTTTVQYKELADMEPMEKAHEVVTEDEGHYEKTKKPDFDGIIRAIDRQFPSSSKKPTSNLHRRWKKFLSQIASWGGGKFELVNQRRDHLILITLKECEGFQLAYMVEAKAMPYKHEVKYTLSFDVARRDNGAGGHVASLFSKAYSIDIEDLTAYTRNLKSLRKLFDETVSEMYESDPVQ